MKTIKVWTDGSCNGNENKDISKRAGGWAYIRDDGVRNCGSYINNPTNNRSELLAISAALNSINEKAAITIVTDSAYAMTTLSPEGRAQRKASRIGNTVYLKSGKPAENSDLIITLLGHFDRLEKLGATISMEKTRGHMSDPMNNECDRLATNCAIMAQLRRK